MNIIQIGFIIIYPLLLHFSLDFRETKKNTFLQIPKCITGLGIVSVMPLEKLVLLEVPITPGALISLSPVSLFSRS